MVAAERFDGRDHNPYGFTLWMAGGGVKGGQVIAAGPETLIHEAALGWMNAAVKQDSAALDTFLAHDLQYGHAGGTKQTKPEYVVAVTSGPARYESFTCSDLKITIYGAAAALTAYCRILLPQNNLSKLHS